MRISPFFLMLLAIPGLLLAQVTTSNITGVVKAATGEPLTGATVTAVHQPTGTTYRVQTRAQGRYDIPNASPGGPYTINVTYVGYAEQRKNDVFLTLGEVSNHDFSIAPTASELGNVSVTTIRATNRASSGVETSIGRDKMANLPTVGRNLNDFVRFTPQAKIGTNGGISIAGQNNRFNSFMIDGAVNNDVFGLSDQGTNGGRAGAPPISIDAIDQITVQVSPYDVSLGNFTGGGINAITRRGSNTTTGSLYYLYRNENLTGKTPIGPKETASRLVDFSNKTFGFRVGGPIIKNKLFYFLNLDLQDDERPQPFNSAGYVGNALKNDSLKLLLETLRSKYNYDPGDYINNPDLIKARRLSTRFDYNINNNNQLIVSYRYSYLERTNPPRSSNTAINFFNSAEFFPSTTHSGNAELNSRFANRSNNKFRISYTNVVDDRGATGTPFPFVTIRDVNNANVNFGTETASSANLLKQSILNFYDIYQYYLGKHTFKAGFDIDYNSSYNLFINRGLGNYEYSNFANFLLDRQILRYRRGYSISEPNKTGDNATSAAAEFDSWRLGLFIGDDIKFTNNFTLNLGIRADRTAFLTDVPVDKFFNDSAAPIIAKFYDLKGARSGNTFNPRFAIAPRVGFTYRIPEEAVTIRGGIGLFSGRTPLVWPGGLYQNNGVTIGAVDQSNISGKVFRADPSNQYTQADFGLTAAIPQGDMNLIAEDYRLPMITKTTLGIDKRLGKGWTLSLDGLIQKNIYETNWKNVAFDPAQIKSTGVGQRSIYSTTGRPNNIPLRATGSATQRSPYTSIILIENTEGNKGFSYNFSASIDKAFDKGWAANVSYTHGDSYVTNEGTSSVNFSNWANMESVSGRNYNMRSRSDFSIGHRISAYISKRFSYNSDLFGTTFSLYYNGQSGNPFSYVYANASGIVGSITGDNVQFNDLIYVPTESEIQNMLFDANTVSGVTYDANAQRAAFNNFINGDKYLSKRRGQFAERNGGRLPFSSVIDLKVIQDINVKVSGKKYGFQITLDMFNFTNFINRDWGRQYFLNFDQYSLLQWSGYTGTEPKFRYNPTQSQNTISDGINAFNSSRWSSQLGLRFNFN